TQLLCALRLLSLLSLLFLLFLLSLRLLLRPLRLIRRLSRPPSLPPCLSSWPRSLPSCQLLSNTSLAGSRLGRSSREPDHTGRLLCRHDFYAKAAPCLRSRPLRLPSFR